MVEVSRISECHGFGLATVMMRRDSNPAVLGAAVGARLPTGSTCIVAGDLAWIGTGPGTWLAFARNASSTWASDLAARCSGASISDQSGAYAVFEITGPDARPLLQRDVSIDLDPAVFVTGSAATTVVAHIGAVIWKLDDDPRFNVAVFRSFAASFREWLQAASPPLDP